MTNYSGFIELEFLIDKHNKIYLIECNPRISGTIRCMLNKYDIPYVYNLVNPYINLFSRQKFDVHYYDNDLELSYNGKFKRSRYSISSEGKIHFDK